MGEPGGSRGHLSNLSDHLSGLNSGIGSRNFEDSCSSATILGPPSYASVNIDLSLNTLTSLVPPLTTTMTSNTPTTNTGQQSIYTMPDSSHHQIPIGSDKSLRPATSPTTPTNHNCVPNFLRPQRYLHSNRSLSLSGCVDQLMTRNSFRGAGNNNTNNASHFLSRLNVEPPQSRSLENLVLHTAAIGQSRAMTMLEDDQSLDSASGVTVQSVLQVEQGNNDVGQESRDQQRGRRDSSKSRHNSTSSVI